MAPGLRRPVLRDVGLQDLKPNLDLSRLTGLCRANGLEFTEKISKISQLFKCLILDTVRIKVHYIVPSFTYFLKLFDKNSSVNLQVEFRPFQRFFEQALVLAKREIGRRFHSPPPVCRISCCSQLPRRKS